MSDFSRAYLTYLALMAALALIGTWTSESVVFFGFPDWAAWILPVATAISLSADWFRFCAGGRVS